MFSLLATAGVAAGPFWVGSLGRREHVLSAFAHDFQEVVESFLLCPALGDSCRTTSPISG